MRRKSLVYVFAALALFACAAVASPVYGTAVGAPDWTGSRYLAPGGGLNSHNGENGWIFPESSTISWSIIDNANGTFTYNYYFTRLLDEVTEPIEMSHFILELSPGCIIEGQSEGQSECVSDFRGEQEFRKGWNSSGPGNSNPGMPASIYGVKFDEEFSVYSFISNRIPVWGNFYAKKGNSGLWNLGLEPSYSSSSNTLYFIPRPDTFGPGGEIPEPATVLLLGAGLAVAGLLRRQKQA